MAWQGKVLAVALFLMAQLFAMIPAATPVEPTLVWDGDRVVDGDESYLREVILLEGNLTVTGCLRLAATELIVSGLNHGDRTITVARGGSLFVESGSYIHSSDPDARFSFAVYSDGSLCMNASRLSDCGWDDFANPGNSPEDVRGLYIASDGSSVTNSTLTGNAFGVIIDGGSAPVIRNNNISKNDADGIRVLGGSSPTIDHNTVSGNALTYPWFLCYQADLTTEGSSPRITNNTLGAVTEEGAVFPNIGLYIGEGGSPVVENNLIEGMDGEFSSYYGILVSGDTTAKIHKNHLKGNLEALVAFDGRLTVTDNVIERGTPVSQMSSCGLEDGTASSYANNTVKGYVTGVLAVSPSTGFFENLTVTDCPVGMDAFSTPGATFAVTVANSTFARNTQDVQATNPHFGPGGTVTLLNPSYDRNKVAAAGSSERLVVAWSTGARARFESNGRAASGALFNLTDQSGALAFQAFAGPDGSVGPLPLVEYVLSGGARSVKSPYTASVARDRWTNKTTIQADRVQNVDMLLDDLPPWVRFENPENGTLLNCPSLRVAGSCEPRSSVRLNGAQASVSGDGRWSAGLVLEEGPNLLLAVATDAGGNTASAERSVVLDTTLPELAVLAPRDGLLTNRSRLEVTGTAEPSARLKVNGGAVDCGPDGAFSVEVELFEGENHIIIECRDAAGNLNSISRLVTLDTVAPELVITDPENGTLTREPALTLSGRAEAGSVVTVNGGPVNLNGGGFLIHGTLAEGENVFVLQSRDRAGNTATASVTVRLDTIAPVVTVLAPSDGSLLNRSTVEVRGTVEPGATVKVQGAKVVFQGTGFGVNLTIPAQGPYTITIEARDAARNIAETSLTVTLDTVEPALKLTGPAPGTVTNQSAIKITGKSEAGASVRLGGKMVVADQKGAFCFTAALPAEGKNVLVVEAVDRAGNRAELALEVFRDTVLTYNLTPPAERTRAGTVLIRGLAEPGSTVTVAGRSLALAGDGSFAAEVPLETGPNEIRVTVRDRAGNQGETVLEVTREKPAAATSTPGFEALWMLSGLGLVLAIWCRKRK